MRKASMIGIALLAALALSAGAFAYPAVVGFHPFATAHPSTPTTVSHPRGDDNSTGNQTNDNETGDHQGNETGVNQDNDTGDNETAPTPPAAEDNETENETGMSMVNVTVDHNVTVSHSDNVTWVNGTITVMQNGTAIVTATFQIVAHDNGTATATINVTQAAGSETVTVHGFATFSPEDHAGGVFGVAKATQNGSVLWERFFAFEVPSSGSSGS